MKNVSQLYDDISKYTMTGKITVEEMNVLIYQNFKKRRIGLLDNVQLLKLLDVIKEFCDKKNPIK